MEIEELLNVLEEYVNENDENCAGALICTIICMVISKKEVGPLSFLNMIVTCILEHYGISEK